MQHTVCFGVLMKDGVDSNGVVSFFCRNVLTSALDEWKREREEAEVLL